VRINNNIDLFFALVRSGLWEDSSIAPNLNLDYKANWEKVYQLASEQSVLGLLLAGLEHSDSKPPQELILRMIGEVQMIEQKNTAMNFFVAKLIELLQNEKANAVLVKGQGIAQCYERPLWRSCGDVDLLLDEFNYEKAKKVLVPKCGVAKTENASVRHFPLEIESWMVELHGTLNTGLSSKIDKEQYEIQEKMFENEEVRTWKNGKTEVYLPSADNDVVFVFCHFIKHFYKGGLGLRQICDWCRLLWTYKDSLNHGLLESRIRKMGLMSEWKVFAAFAVEYIGMPKDAMPFFNHNDNHNLHRKAEKILDFVLETGNFGANRGRCERNNYFIVRKIYSLGHRCNDIWRHSRLFPLDSMRFFGGIVFNGLKYAFKGIG
jgi:hypothetical protein